MNKFFIILGVFLVGCVIWFFSKDMPDGQSLKMDELFNNSLGYQPVSSASTPGLTGDYSFSAEIPKSWKMEAVPQIESIAIYDTSETKSYSLDDAKIFIRKFTANQFLTLSTVNIFTQDKIDIKGRPAVRYEIEKKKGVGDFPNQPAWRNRRHIVTDIRSTDESPTVFYVVAKNPDLDDSEYQRFLNSIVFNPDTTDISWVLPISEMKGRVKLKKFGMLIDPKTSPVQPERFSGYHTGIDVEYSDVNDDVSVSAIGNGQVVVSRLADGYGGVVVIDHRPWAEIFSIYGHLDPVSTLKTGVGVVAGQKIGILGEDKSDETDGERKHLHFGIIKNAQPTIAGYVQNESELSAWMDPLELWGH